MKKKILASLLAGLFGCTAALAANPGSAQVGTWSITDNHLITAGELASALAVNSGAELEGKALGDEIIKIYRSHGYLTVEARVDQAAKTIHIVESKSVTASGKYASYINSVAGTLNKNAIERAAMRMTPTAKLNGEQVSVDIQGIDPKTGNVEVRTSATAAQGAKKSGASFGYSSVGQRYSGPDVATAYGWANLGNGQQIDVSLAHGFSNTSKDSQGGRYESVSTGYRRSSQFGLTSLQYAFTNYKTGGAFAPLDLSGTVSRATLEHSYLVTKNLTAIGRIFYAQNKQDFGLVHFTDQENYAAMFGGLIYQSTNWAANAGIEQGLGGSRKFNFAPLMGGKFDASYTALIVNAAGSVDIGKGWTATGKAGFQSSQSGAPSSSQFALGGPGRGSSYNAGFSATPSGAYASLTVDAPRYRGVQGYAGIDGAFGSPVVGPSRKAKSLFVGARYNVAGGITGDIGFAKAIGRNDDSSAKDSKLNISISYSF